MIPYTVRDTNDLCGDGLGEMGTELGLIFFSVFSVLQQRRFVWELIRWRRRRCCPLRCNGGAFTWRRRAVGRQSSGGRRCERTCPTGHTEPRRSSFVFFVVVVFLARFSIREEHGRKIPPKPHQKKNKTKTTTLVKFRRVCVCVFLRKKKTTKKTKERPWAANETTSSSCERRGRCKQKKNWDEKSASVLFLFFSSARGQWLCSVFVCVCVCVWVCVCVCVCVLVFAMGSPSKKAHYLLLVRLPSASVLRCSNAVREGKRCALLFSMSNPPKKKKPQKTKKKWNVSLVWIPCCCFLNVTSWSSSFSSFFSFFFWKTEMMQTIFLVNLVDWVFLQESFNVETIFRVEFSNAVREG